MSFGLTRHEPGELPAEVTGFVGRRRELSELSRLLRTARLVTVTGPGGVGKTRLALRAAARPADRYADGVRFAELSGLTDPELLADAIAACLGVPEQDAGAGLGAVLGYLRDRRLLLVLDTCEHLLAPVAQLITEALRAAPGVTILATSRQPLDVPGEHVLTLAPLPVPAADAATAGRGDAVELFAMRAAAVVHGFAITPANLPDVIRLCGRLDGIPLAIELATVRLRAVSLSQLADRLEDRFRLLDRGNRAGLPRHQTLLAATNWSYDLCSAHERTLWTRLSVFAGSFDIPAAEQICAGGPLGRRDVLATLIGLVDKSVVLRIEDGTNRYRLLDTIREFGAARLTEPGEQTSLRGRHIDYYLAMAREFNEHLRDNQLERYRALRIEHDNLRAALDHGFTTAGLERAAAGLATFLDWYWHISGLLGEGRYWQSKVLEHFTEPCRERAWALIVHGHLSTNQGVGHPVADLEAGIAMARTIGDQLAYGRGYLYLTLAYMYCGRPREAVSAAATAEWLLTELGDESGLMSLNMFVGVLAMLAGDNERAIEQSERGLRRLGADNTELLTSSYLHLVKACALYATSRYDEAASDAQQGLMMKSELGDLAGVAYALDLLGWIAAATRRAERAAWLLGAADGLWSQVASRLSGAAVLEGYRQRAEQTARAALGDERFAALHEQGERHQREHVTALALGDADKLFGAAGRVADSSGVLTSRENEIAALVAKGLSSREIAVRLMVAKRTVDSHIEHIFTKLGVSSRIQLINRLGAWEREDGAADR